ncbi:TetR/AcrR family transcriptional regulator [Streptomyces sp. NPDC059215]|uniref:TetR/AcrR family transcriptional regulator n=1 Tax=Streptomyces sp. NPDC059215 TaxID=3346772 RepID=UPI0036982F77
MDTTPPSVRQRRGRGARERILKAAGELFTARGLNATGIELLAHTANVSKRTLYTHFASKDDLVHAFLTSIEDDLLPASSSASESQPDPRAQLLAIFDWQPNTPDSPVRGCPFLNAAIEFPDPEHPVHQLAAAYRNEFAQRLIALARAAGASDPQRLGEQLALLYDGAEARSVALNSTAIGAAAHSVATKLIDAAITSIPT